MKKRAWGESRMSQQSFADMEYANRKRKTKRDEFLGIMEEVIPWDEWCAIVEPYYPCLLYTSYRIRTTQRRWR